MKTRNIIDANVGGRPVDMFESRTESSSNKWLLMFFGTGELGPSDGSQLHEMDNYGYQKTSSFETEWNVLAPQAQKTYDEFDLSIFDWMIEQYGNDIEIVIIGHSLGGREVMDLVNAYRGNKLPKQVVGAIAVAGEMSGPYPLPDESYDLPCVAFHGKSDTTISYWQSIKWVNHLNKKASRVHKAQLRIIDGYGHTSIMTYVFQPSRDAEGYRTIRAMYSWDTAVECKAILDEVNLKATFYLPDGSVKNYTLINPV